MRIAINVARIGGIGGVSRNVYTFVRAMMDHEIDIYTMQFIPRGFVPQGENITIRWFEKKNDGLHIAIEKDKEYDLYFYYASRIPIYLGDQLNTRKKVVIPSGNDVRAIEGCFDYVYCQAEDGIRYFDDIRKKLAITPCVIIPVDQTEPVEGIPSAFFLTVFNPYELNRQYQDGLKPCKGYDLVYELADSFALPLVWCHTSETLPIKHNIREHPNIIHLDNLKQEKMYYLYQKTTAYVSFSREESFGWSIADAIMFDKPIISRRIGVLSSLDSNQKGLYFYRNTQELRDLFKYDAFESGSYDKECFSAERFEEKLLSLAGYSLS
jgi:glycosyltransferase involved in cell wall biosynthesis